MIFVVLQGNNKIREILSLNLEASSEELVSVSSDHEQTIQQRRHSAAHAVWLAGDLEEVQRPNIAPKINRDPED